MMTTAATFHDISNEQNDSLVLENASSAQENHATTTPDTTGTVKTPSKVSSPPAWCKNGPTFAELLKQNIEVAPVAKIRTGVPIMSIPATNPSSLNSSTNAAKKKTTRPLGATAATSASAFVGKKEMQAATTSARPSDIVSDSNKTPSMKSRAAPESPSSPSVQQATNSSGISNVSSNANMPSPPMSEIAADDNQGQSSPPPAVNVWQVRMAQNMGSGTGSGMGSVNGEAADGDDVSGADNVDGLLDAVEKKLTLSATAASDLQQSGGSGDHGDDSFYNHRRKYPYQQQQKSYQRGSNSSRGYVSNGGGSGYPRTSRPRGAYNGVSTGGSPRYYGVRSNQQAFAYPVVDVDTLKFYLLGQIEYYFSVENLCRDLFFRSQMDANGWVPISLIAGFNRVRAYTTELSLVKEAIAQSVILEMNEESIRKKEDWHLWVLPKALESQSQTQAAEAQGQQPQP